MITKGVPALPRPDSICVLLPDALEVVRGHHDYHRISRKVALALIAAGISFEGGRCKIASSIEWPTRKGTREILTPVDDLSVCLPPGFEQCQLSVIRGGETELLPISKRVAAELIAAGTGYQG